MVKLRFFVAGHLEGGAVNFCHLVAFQQPKVSPSDFEHRLRAGGARAGQDEATHLGIANRGFGASVLKTIDNFALHPETFDDADCNVRPLSRERQPEVRTE